jgi:hypothetical protein
MRNFLQKLVGFIYIIDRAAVMVQTVGKDQEIDLQRHIVAHYLVEDVLIDQYLRSFAFDDQQWFSQVIVHHDIGSLSPLIEFQAAFN